jgi:NADPH:quinone reductase
MRAAVCHEYGSPSVVRVEEWPTPPLVADQVRVKVGAASVNFPDVLILANRYQLSVPVPFVPGSEFAGVVAAVADGVTAWSVGDRVMGTLMHGAFAEEVVVGVGSLRRIPGGIADQVAAAFGVAHRTAYHVLRSVAKVQPGEEVVVLGAGGGVGLAAVQIARLFGANATAVASSRDKLDVAASLGATTLINHRECDVKAMLRRHKPGGVDVVVDPVGGDLSEIALRSLRWAGRFVTVGYASGVIPKIPLNLVLLKGMQIVGFQFQTFTANAADEFERNEADLAEHFAAGRVAPHVGAVVSLDNVVEALQLVADGKVVGKVVVDMTT